MLDFLKITQVVNKKTVEIHPKFMVRKSKDLMIRGGDFYAIWDEENGLWSTDEYKAVSIIDHELDLYLKEHKHEIDAPVRMMYLWDADTGSIDRWRKYVKLQLSDNYVPLDEKLIFSNTKCTKEDYASKKLNYPLADGDISAWDKLVSVLYNPDERMKIEWAIGAIVSGESKNLQKFLVLYGSAGTGKSTVLNIIQDLFSGYFAVFDAKALGSKSDAFALEPFTSNPLVAIQHDGDLSHIEDNTRLNSVVSHEIMTVNAKFKSAYSAKFNAFLFMGTNKPVKITDAKSGILRRLIDVSPSGKKIPLSTYNQLMSQIKFELGAIAKHCLDLYNENPAMYDNYIPIGMLGASNDFYNFVLDSFDVFTKSDGVTLKQAWEMYKQYCQDSNVPYPYQMRIFREELKNYFESFEERAWDGDTDLRNYYKGFKSNKFENVIVKHGKMSGIKFEEQDSIFDLEYAKCKAQYGSETETPQFKWDNVTTKLCELDTHKLHYVRLPKNHIVIDFDLKDKDGNKSYKKNIEAANKWPKTYAELSKSGQGIHLHYIYDGDVSKLARLYSEDVEVKIFTGKSSLRRKLTKCNNEPIATINSGLPLKEENKTVNFDSIKNEKAIRTIIIKNLRKEYHANTKPSVDFIYKTLEDAYSQGVKYDVRDLRPDVQAFCLGSSHQVDACMALFRKMRFCSEEENENMAFEKDQIVFFDVEVFPNLFVVVWKPLGESNQCIKMINPDPADIEGLLKFKLVGFNNRRYDNHILYARLMGYDNEQLYELSQRLIADDNKARFREAYKLGYTDILDYASAANKMSLKKWEIKLGIHHQELGLPWDQPVAKELWSKVADYCVNDVVATEAVWNATQGDWIARKILAELAGGNVGETTNALTMKIIFGKERHPKLIYTDLATGEQY